MTDTETLLLKVMGGFALVLLNGFFVAAEFAFIRLRDTQIEALIAKGSRRARLARAMSQNIEACISATQLGITLCSLGLGALLEPLFSDLLDPAFKLFRIHSEEAQHTIAFLVGFLTNTFLLTVLGELVPKSVANRRTLQTSLWIAWPLTIFYRISYPLIWALNRSSEWVLARLGIQPLTESERGHSEEELRLLVTSSRGKVSATKLGRDIIINALDLKRRVVREVMRPRKEILALDTEASLAECMDVAEETRYSRFPLCVGGDLDQTLGVVHVKDLYAMRLKARRGADLAGVAKKIIFVPETARLERLLGLFLERKLHFALVIDEYGMTTGMATLENILEELVGQIQDEFDVEKPLAEKKGEHVWELSGALPLHELSDLVGEPLAEEGITTTNGLVTRRLGGFAKPGDKLVLGNYELAVEETDGPRVTRLKLARRAEPAATG
ncbi:MAG TPA: hemolysin family protein [Verrucomicrobiae bacterium]|jgi:CBS domain containing-hemolysin-like protein